MRGDSTLHNSADLTEQFNMNFSNRNEQARERSERKRLKLLKGSLKTVVEVRGDGELLCRLCHVHIKKERRDVWSSALDHIETSHSTWRCELCQVTVRVPFPCDDIARQRVMESHTASLMHLGRGKLTRTETGSRKSSLELAEEREGRQKRRELARMKPVERKYDEERLSQKLEILKTELEMNPLLPLELGETGIQCVLCRTGSMTRWETCLNHLRGSRHRDAAKKRKYPGQGQSADGYTTLTKLRKRPVRVKPVRMKEEFSDDLYFEAETFKNEPKECDMKQEHSEYFEEDDTIKKESRDGKSVEEVKVELKQTLTEEVVLVEPGRSEKNVLGCSSRNLGGEEKDVILFHQRVASAVKVWIIKEFEAD